MSTWNRIVLACLSLICLGLAPTGAAIAQVKVTAATPSSAYQGTTSLDVVVAGSGFDASAKVQFFVSGTTDSGGIAVRNVVYRKSTELVATIDVASGAALSSYDIQVMLDSGRKGKGTTLFAVKPKPNDAPPPTYPAARYWHAMASNGGTTTSTSRLYMFAGTGGAESAYTVYGDLWAYSNAGSSGAAWTYISAGSTGPGPRTHTGWSCGGGRCVTSNGSYFGALKETWVYTESTSSWSQVPCSRRVLCPPARMFPTMAYDAPRGTHLLFGGSDGRTATSDTYTFTPGTMTWVANGTSAVVSPRSRAAAAFVPPLGRIVLFGGQQENVRALNDMFWWSGSAWASLEQVVDSTLGAVPSLHSHSIAWDPTGNRLIVTGGFVDVVDTPNSNTFYVTFAGVGGVWRATWTAASGIGCQSTAGSSPDTMIHPGARMAFDAVAGSQLFFGGVENVVDGGAVAYGNTVECR